MGCPALAGSGAQLDRTGILAHLALGPDTSRSSRLLTSGLCRPSVCPSVVGNVLVYFDAHYLTSSYVKTLTLYLEPRLLRTSPALRT